MRSLIEWRMMETREYAPRARLVLMILAIAGALSILAFWPPRGRRQQSRAGRRSRT